MYYKMAKLHVLANLVIACNIVFNAGTSDNQCANMNQCKECCALSCVSLQVCIKKSCRDIICNCPTSALQRYCTFDPHQCCCYCTPLVTANTSTSWYTTSSSTVLPTFTSPSTVLSSLPTTLSSSVNTTQNELAHVSNSLDLVIGLSVVSIFLFLTLLVTGVVLWRWSRRPKTQSSTLVTSSNIGSNENGLVLSPSPCRVNDYDQIVIDNTLRTLYTPPTAIKDNSSMTQSNTPNQLDVTESSLTNIRQDYTKLGELKRDTNTYNDPVPNNNISIRNGNPPDLGEVEDGVAGFVENYHKPNDGSVYFELETSYDQYEKHNKDPGDTRMSLNPPKNAGVFSDLSKMNTNAESNLPVRVYLASPDTSSLQLSNDKSTYFELEKLDEDDDDNTTDTNSKSTDQYSKLRQVSRDVGNDYNELSTLDTSTGQ